tara:strand:+ start:720 stop:1085 length:366 start_codon:yes stop_codon:yes gene_type:complete
VQFKYLILIFILSIFCLIFLVYDLSNSKRTDQLSKVVVVSKGWNSADCKKEMGTKVIYLGERPSAGYSINLKDSYTVNDKFYLILEEKTPKDTEISAQVITNPCIELRIPKTKKTIEIRWE